MATVNFYRDMQKALLGEQKKVKVQPFKTPASMTKEQAVAFTTSKWLDAWKDRQAKETDRQDRSSANKILQDYTAPRTPFNPDKYGTSPADLMVAAGGGSDPDDPYWGPEPTPEDQREFYTGEANKVREAYETGEPAGGALVRQQAAAGAYNMPDQRGLIGRLFNAKPSEGRMGDRSRDLMTQILLGDMDRRQTEEAAKLARSRDMDALEAKTLAQIRVKQSGSGKDGKGETWGKTPVWGKGPSGNPVLGVVSDDGNFKPLDTGSFNPERQGLQKVDAGDHWAFIDSTGQVVSTQKKRLSPGEEPVVRGNQAAESARGSLEGQTGSQARIDLPKLQNSATEMLALLDKIENHPGLSGVVGIPSLVGAVGGLRGTPEADFNVLLDQVKGKQFMEAYQSLKGGGVITEVEGEKATDALARMNTAQTEEAFKDGLKDFRDVINRGLIIAEDRARIRPDTTEQPAAVSGVPTSEDIAAEMELRGLK